MSESHSKRNPEILCLGEAMAEFVRQGTQDSDTWISGVGGDTSNAAIAAARQGGSVGYLSALGADRFGMRILRLWESEGIDTSGVLQNPDAATGIYFIDPDPAERHFTYFRTGSAASLFGVSDLDTDRLLNARILHTSGITLAVSGSMRNASLAAMERMREAGRDVSLDTNLRLKLWDVETARTVLDRAAALATVLITSVDDSAHLTGVRDPDAILSRYRNLGPRIVIVTLGAEGARIAVNDEIRTIAASPADPVDSSGAGDSFSGAFLSWWLETGDPFLAARLAGIVAAGTVSGLGAVRPVPGRREVLEKARRQGIALPVA